MNTHKENIDGMMEDRIGCLEQGQARREEAIKNILARLDSFEGKFDKYLEDREVRHKELDDRLEKRFAAKWTEIVLGGMLALILTAFVMTLISFVFAPHASAEFTYNVLLNKLL